MSQYRDELESFTHKGQAFTAFLELDQDMREPWKEHDGHGPVSDWRPKDSKRPGEMVLLEDRGRCLFYDFQAAVKLALKDGWDTPPYKQGKPGERAQRAAMADFERMRDWCLDRWQWVGVIVKDAYGNETSVWGIESDCTDYLKETARELANDLIREQTEKRRAADVRQAFVGCDCT